MDLSECKICHNKAKCFVCSRCKIEQYCSVICQIEGWETHKLTCCKKKITINFHYNIIEEMMVIGENTKFSTITLNMSPCPELHKLNPATKACWEATHDIILPNLENLPFTISFVINDKLQTGTIINDYSNLKKNYSTTCKLQAISGGIVFDIYRSVDDTYKIFHICFLELHNDNVIHI